MKRLLLILIIPILSTSCHFSNKYQNRESDKQDAEKITAELFGNITQSDFEKATELFGEEFFKVTSKADLIKIFESTKNKLGELKSTELVDWNTMISEGAIEKGVYNLNYNADFEKDKAQLKITLTKNENGKIKVVGYNIRSNAFLN
jgi:PBP1b-binding outer membrane lipoprotein LpoB